jgi:hypothetical protein
MSAFKSPLAIASTMLILALNLLNPVQAQVFAQRRTLPSRKAPKAAPVDLVYQKAQQDLSPDLYVLYRVTERIARANDLAGHPWRIAITQDYDVNAFATDVNLIAVLSGLVDQLAGDSSALACMIGHEMGHQVKRHVAVGIAQKKQMLEQAREEAIKEYEEIIGKANRTARDRAIGGSILSLFGSPGSLGNSILEHETNKDMVEYQQQLSTLIERKQKEVKEKLAEAERKQEFEADESGYVYAATAGFEPEGCVRAMDVLSRTPSAELDTDHPSIPKRVEALKALITKQPGVTLAAQGKTRLTATKPLTYSPSLDNVSLRINPVSGGSSSDDLKRLFGQ